MMRNVFIVLMCVLLFLVFFIFHSSNPAIAFICMFGGVILFLVFLSVMTSHAKTRNVTTRVMPATPPPEPVRPKLSIPTTARMAHEKLSNFEFELFAAAVIIGGEHLGHTFSRHCGKSGDKGTDVVLKDRFTRPVCVQAKRYRLGNSVKSSQVREFSSSIRRYRAHSGYFVTTSTFTRDGYDHCDDENFRAPRGSGNELHLIDAQRLDELLRAHPAEIERAWHYVLARHHENS